MAETKDGVKFQTIDGKEFSLPADRAKKLQAALKSCETVHEGKRVPLKEQKIADFKHYPERGTVVVVTHPDYQKVEA